MADRVGVIAKGELILVEEKAELMRKLGKKQLVLQLSAAARRRFRRSSGRMRWSCRRTAASSPSPTTRTPGAPASPRCSTTCAPPASALPTSTRRSPRSKTSSSISSGASNEPARGQSHLHVRDVARLPHDHAEHHLAGAVDVALFHRLRRGDRLAHRPDRRRQLRRLHRAGADHAAAADAVDRQRLVRHLLPALHRHHLRAPVGADLAARDRARLRRRRGDEVDHPRPHHPRAPRRCSCRCTSPTRSGCSPSWC